MTVVLIGVKTEIEWQLAFQSVKHAERGKLNTLTFETPSGDVTLTVIEIEGQTIVEKVR